MSKRANAEYPIHDLVADRWSPYAFEPKAVDVTQLACCLEAARWAASSFNEQPWRFLVAPRTDEEGFARLLSTLLEPNQDWAKNASVLMLTTIQRAFTRNGRPNRMAEHDMGLAIGNLSLQATHFGLSVHQMAGINVSKARQVCQLPEKYEPLTAIAIGYAADDPGEFAERDQAERKRRDWSETFFRTKFGVPWRENSQ